MWYFFVLGAVFKLESNWKTMWEKLGTDPHNEKEGKREARKQNLVEL